ncbi:hypothetical protein CROQUDRAFT_85701 [Cronartium quercuum f. sp. fusiforme G11]|uniref:Uncharacterized protein n=1 Tax=Cronartium quercuum f. sp. fusiforme G11 TaxID=708437 RepID=A0A9P6NVV2_9BASI|nr:hypothetical protein CROQUDRAFT_85701 [Cronartium quercuum f. sp. fusiforme G11]
MVGLVPTAPRFRKLRKFIYKSSSISIPAQQNIYTPREVFGVALTSEHLSLHDNVAFGSRYGGRILEIRWSRSRRSKVVISYGEPLGDWEVNLTTHHMSPRSMVHLRGSKVSSKLATVCFLPFPPEARDAEGFGIYKEDIGITNDEESVLDQINLLTEADYLYIPKPDLRELFLALRIEGEKEASGARSKEFLLMLIPPCHHQTRLIILSRQVYSPLQKYLHPIGAEPNPRSEHGKI